MVRRLLILSAILMLSILPAKSVDYNIKADNLIKKLAAIDSQIDRAFLNNNYSFIQNIDFKALNKEIEEILINTQINQSKARMIWMYCGKIYIKAKKHFSNTSKDFRLSPSDYQPSLPPIEDIKKTFFTSKWLYLSSKKSKI